MIVVLKLSVLHHNKMCQRIERCIDITLCCVCSREIIIMVVLTLAQGGSDPHTLTQFCADTPPPHHSPPAENPELDQVQSDY